MRLIDADELTEAIWRERLDTRERIADLVARQPTVKTDVQAAFDKMRLIDADELKKGLKDLKAEGYNQKYVQGLQDAIDNYFSQIIDDAPTADVQPVKHGKWVEREITRMKWIPNDDDNVNPDDVEPERMTEQKCSYCNRWTIKFTDHIELNYCPLCGAKMDGDSE